MENTHYNEHTQTANKLTISVIESHSLSMTKTYWSKLVVKYTFIRDTCHVGKNLIIT